MLFTHWIEFKKATYVPDDKWIAPQSVDIIDYYSIFIYLSISAINQAM